MKRALKLGMGLLTGAMAAPVTSPTSQGQQKQAQPQSDGGQGAVAVVQAKPIQQVEEATAPTSKVESTPAVVAPSSVSDDFIQVPLNPNAEPEVFCKACEQGDLVQVKTLLGEGHDVNAREGKWGWSPVMWAIYGNHNELAEYLLTKTRCQPDQEDHYGKTALHVACKNGNFEMVKYLLNRGADVNYLSTKVSDPWTPLMYASKYGFPDLCRYLISCGARLDTIDYEFKSAFDMASDDETRDAFRADSNLLDSSAGSSFWEDVLVCYFCENQEQATLALNIKQSLVERNLASVALLPSNTDFALVVRKIRKCSCLVVVLSNAFASDSKCCRIVNVADGMGSKKFMVALCAETQFPPKGILGSIFTGTLYQDCSGRFALVSKSLLDLSIATEQMLVDAMSGMTDVPGSNGASVQQSEQELEAAARRNRVLQGLKYDPAKSKKSGLFAKGGCPDVLIESSKSGNVEALRKAIASGMKPGLDLCDGQHELTPLMWASNNGQLDCCKVIVDAGANINLTDRRGASALSFASKNGHCHVIEYLILVAGCNPNFLAPIGMPALHHAASRQQFDACRLLLSLGANRFVADHAGKQAVDLCENDPKLLNLFSPRSAALKAEFSDRDVFISYNWAQQQLCIELAKQIQKQTGLSVWQDINQMKSGDSLYWSLAKGIQEAEVIVMCVAPGYLRSANCLKEVALSQSLGKQIVLVCLEDNVPDFPPKEGIMVEWFKASPKPFPLFKNDNQVSSEFYKQIKDKFELIMSKRKAELAKCDAIQFGKFRADALAAVQSGNVAGLRAMVENEGLDLDARDEESKWTLLMHACYGQHLGMVKYISSLANINLIDTVGKMAFHIACKYGSLPIVQMLIEKGAAIHFLASGFNFTIESVDYWSAGMYATEHGQYEIASLLLRCDVDPFRRNEMLKSMKSLAEDKNDARMLEMIQSNNRKVVGLDPSMAVPMLDLTNKDLTIDVVILYHGAWREVAREIALEFTKTMGKTVYMDEGQYDTVSGSAAPDPISSLGESVRRQRYDQVLDKTKFCLVLCSESLSRDRQSEREVCLASDKRKSIVSLLPKYVEDDELTPFPPSGAVGAVLAPFPVVQMPVQINPETQSRQMLTNKDQVMAELAVLLQKSASL